MRYVAFVIQDHAGWVVVFPDFPDIRARGRSIREALLVARRALSDRALTLRWAGAPMPTPMSAAALVNTPCYSYSMLAIVATPGPQSPQDNLFNLRGGRPRRRVLAEAVEKLPDGEGGQHG